MKLSKILVLISLILLVCSTGIAQRKLGGKVVEVLDGKTVVIELDNRRLTAVIQYIETPEREQPLFRTVRDHLEKLVLGKDVEFDPHGVELGKTFGQLYVGSLDIARQLLRDGAAWHVSSVKSGQGLDETAAYRQNEDEAKSEKRGVWGIANMKPAWEFRAEKFENARREQIASVTPPNRATHAATYRKPVRSGIWSDTNPSLKNIGALLNGYNAKTRSGYLGTSLLGVYELDKEKEIEQQKTAVDITYFYKEDEKNGRKGTYVITLVSSSKNWRFSKRNDLVLVVDEKESIIAKARRTVSRGGDMVAEKLTYEVSRNSMEKIVNGGDVLLKIGDYTMQPTSGLQLMLYNLLQVSGS